jgi:hypothetical protein
MESGWTNINIFNCEFYTDDADNSRGGTASIYVSQGPSVNIYNNTFNRDRNSRAIGIVGNNLASNNQTVRIYNNSFLNGPAHVSISGEPLNSRRKIYIQNNIFYRDEGSSTYVMINHQGGTFPVTLDRNIYFDPDYSESKRYVLYTVESWYCRLSDLKARGFEPNGRYVNPGYLDIDPVLNSQDDMRLEPGALASSGGANLSTLFQIDKAELPRPATGPWSVGAYTAAATSLSSSSLVAPTGLRLVSVED